MEKDININFFKPVGDFMKRDVAMKKIIIVIWFLISFGFMFLLRIVANPNVTVTLEDGTTRVVGESFLTKMQFLGFPFHYWFSAQFAILGFILLCLWYCKFVEKLEKEMGHNEE